MLNQRLALIVVNHIVQSVYATFNLYGELIYRDKLNYFSVSPSSVRLLIL